MLNDKAIPICVLEVLKEYSSEKQIMSMSDIRKRLSSGYGINPDRRTIYSAIEVLLELGYDISLYNENKRGYYLRERTFETSEIHLLSDAVCTFPFISEKQTRDLLDKVQSMVSASDRKQIKNLTVFRSDKKSMNKAVFYNIDLLDEAIESKVKVKFDYLEYGSDKKLHNRREKKYTVNPYGMVYTNEHYYLICIMAKQKTVSMYRIDRIKNIEITNYELDEREKDFSPDNAIENAVYAYSGNVDKITILVDSKHIGDVIDKFGTDINISENDDGRLKITLKASIKGMKYWALQYIDYVEVVFPTELREDIIKSVENSCYKSNLLQ